MSFVLGRPQQLQAADLQHPTKTQFNCPYFDHSSVLHTTIFIRNISFYTDGKMSRPTIFVQPPQQYQELGYPSQTSLTTAELSRRCSNIHPFSPDVCGAGQVACTQGGFVSRSDGGTGITTCAVEPGAPERRLVVVVVQQRVLRGHLLYCVSISSKALTCNKIGQVLRKARAHRPPGHPPPSILDATICFNPADARFRTAGLVITPSMSSDTGRGPMLDTGKCYNRTL
ncbi:hypothetical protein DE146DRAFT_627090 [Phaeosphaeria sp. MPI-PUGE-AT-0046c]|nr:hypothetical protein DE146DRAFT_627090 [Phaeosphaeria sp. MPI-PUGE-AT-0046c]